MAKLVHALHSECSSRKRLEVRILSGPPYRGRAWAWPGFICLARSVRLRLPLPILGDSFNGRTPPLHDGNGGSIPSSPTNLWRDRQRGPVFYTHRSRQITDGRGGSTLRANHRGVAQLVMSACFGNRRSPVRVRPPRPCPRRPTDRTLLP